MNRWFVCRLAMIAVAISSAPFFINAFERDDFSKPSVAFFFEVTAFIAVGVLFMVFLQSLNPRSDAHWFKPSWSRNPFNSRQPLQMFDASSYYLIASACVVLIMGITRAPMRWFWELPMAIGVGCWIGVRLCIALFRDRFARDEAENS